MSKYVLKKKLLQLIDKKGLCNGSFPCKGCPAGKLCRTIGVDKNPGIRGFKNDQIYGYCVNKYIKVFGKSSLVAHII